MRSRIRRPSQRIFTKTVKQVNTCGPWWRKFAPQGTALGLPCRVTVIEPHNCHQKPHNCHKPFRGMPCQTFSKRIVFAILLPHACWLCLTLHVLYPNKYSSLMMCGAKRTTIHRRAKSWHITLMVMQARTCNTWICRFSSHPLCSRTL